MVSAIHICHWPEIDLAYLLCELLVHRNYRYDVPDAHWLVARFAKLYLDLPKHQRTPFLYDDGITYTTYWGRNDVFLLAVSRSNINAMLVVSLLHQMHEIMEQFFLHQQSQINGADTSERLAQQAQPVFTRESVLDNNAFLYELLDECVDFGVVQITDYNILKEYIKMHINVGKTDQVSADIDSDSNSDSGTSNTKSARPSKKNKHGHSKSQLIKSTHNQAVRTDVESKAADKLINSSIVRTQVSPVSWRLKGIFYSKNEIYIDIIETCDFAYDLETATVKSNQILGVCMVRSYLSGMPVCKLGLNEERLSQVEYDGESDDELTEEGNQLRAEELDEDVDEDVEREDSTKEDVGEDEDRESGEEAKSEDSKDGVEAVVSMTTDLKEDPDTLKERPKNEKKKEKKKKEKKKHKVPLTNVQFHLCVELSTIYKNNLIRFTPPDDKFQLFSFRVEQQKRKQMTPLLLIDPKYRVLKEQRRLQIMCTIKTNFRKKLHCRKLVVRIPLHASLFPLENADQDSFRFRSELGDVRFRVDTSEILWTISDLPGSKKTVRMMAEVNLSNVEYSLNAIPRVFKGAFGISPTEATPEHATERPVATDPKDLLNSIEGETVAPDAALDELDRFYHVNGVSSSLFAQLQRQAHDLLFNDISLDFEIPMLAYSGLRVTYIRVDEESLKYTCFPWVRYVTHSNSESSENTNQGRYRFRLGKSNFLAE